MGRSHKTKHSAEQIIKAISGTAGIVSNLAYKLGVNWHTAKGYIDRMPSVAKAWADECEVALDLAENQMMRAIQGGDGQMIRYLLSTKGKKRGFTERQEHTGADGEEIVVKIVKGVSYDDL